MNRAMRRAWRRDIKRRKRKGMSTVAQTPIDERTMGNNDKLWDGVTEDENLQSLLYDFFMAQPLAIGDGPSEQSERLMEWMENNIAGCSAELYPATRLDQASYCDNPVAPGRGEYCSEHQEPGDVDDDEPYEDPRFI